jgi:hypothetical protein
MKKSFYLLPLLFLSACSTPSKLALHPQSPSSATDTLRYPEVVHAYHFGRSVDPHDSLVMHEQHTVFRVEENTRWDLHPGAGVGQFSTPVSPPDAAFSSVPVNDAVLAEVNAQKLATGQIITESRTLSAALSQFQSALSQTKTNLEETAVLRTAVSDLKQRLAVLEAAQSSTNSPLSTTNAPPDPLSP